MQARKTAAMKMAHFGSETAFGSGAEFTETGLLEGEAVLNGADEECS